MEKLSERESARRPLAAAPALAIQFFLIPLAVVVAVVLVYAGFRVLLHDERSPEEYLNDIRSGGRERRWPAAYELSRLLADPQVRQDPALGPAIVRAFEEARGDDPRVRRYLALALGRFETPPPGALEALRQALRDPDSETQISAILALGAVGDASVVPDLVALQQSADAGIRKVAVYSLGALPGERQLDALRTALGDPVPDVQWNAAVALARHGSRDGVAVLQGMIDREFVEQVVTRVPDPRAEIDPVSEVMISGLRALAALQEETVRESVAALSREDRNLRVRQAALETLRDIGT